MSVRDWFARGLERSGTEAAIEAGGVWWPNAVLRDSAVWLDNALTGARIGENAPIGVVVRNRLGLVAAIAALLATHRTVVMIHGFQPPQKLAADLLRLRLPAVVADVDDWSEEVRAAARAAGTIGIAANNDETPLLRPLAGLDRLGGDDHHPATPDVAMMLLTSGTTSAPKRIALRGSTIEATIEDLHRIAVTSLRRPRVDPNPYLLSFPIGNISGATHLLLSFYQQRPLVLMERFAVEEWVDAATRHRPLVATLPPAALRMLIDQNVPADALTSVEAMRSGAAPLDPTMQHTFERQYGAPILITYGATEFCGPVVAWTMADHEAFAESKRGSVGRVRPGIGIRIVEPAGGAVLPAGESGVIELKVPRIGDAWTRTNDFGLIDEDGFVFIRGRIDDVINRGGFKVSPDEIAHALAAHPDVADICVVSFPDQRLGEVPVAAVVMRKGTEASLAKLESFARQRLSPPQVPAHFLAFDELPKNEAMKTNRPAIRSKFAERIAAGK